jgi:hypothetical protein
MEYTPQGTAALNCLARFRVPVFRAGPGPGCIDSLIGLLRNGVFAGNARRYAICQSVVGWKKDTPKVSTKWLGCVWKSSRTDWELRCWIAMWLAEGGYTTSVHLLLSTSGSVRRLEVNYTWTMADTYIQHRLAALVQVTLDERVSEW